MTRGSVKEYAEAVRERYKGASRKEKGRILDQLTQVTGYHRKAAIRLLGRKERGSAVQRRGRPKEYGVAVGDILPFARLMEDRIGAALP